MRAESFIALVPRATPGSSGNPERAGSGRAQARVGAPPPAAGDAPADLDWWVERGTAEVRFASAAELCAFLKHYAGLTSAELQRRGGFQYLLHLFDGLSGARPDGAPEASR